MGKMEKMENCLLRTPYFVDDMKQIDADHSRME